MYWHCIRLQHGTPILPHPFVLEPASLVKTEPGNSATTMKQISVELIFSYISSFKTGLEEEFQILIILEITMKDQFMEDPLEKYYIRWVSTINCQDMKKIKK